MRWLAATITASLILGVSAIPVDAFSFDPDKIDASFLAEVLAAPTADFDVIVRSDPVDAEKHLDRAAARRASSLTQIRRAITVRYVARLLSPRNWRNTA